MNAKTKKQHNQRVRARKNYKSPKRKSRKDILLAVLGTFLALFLGLALFHATCVEKTKMSAIITVEDITKIQNAKSNTYYVKGNPLVIKSPALYRIKAKSETGEELVFETSSDGYSYYYKFEIEYNLVTIFGKSKIEDAEIVDCLR